VLLAGALEAAELLEPFDRGADVRQVALDRILDWRLVEVFG
jgi:hypothetical protein